MKIAVPLARPIHEPNAEFEARLGLPDEVVFVEIEQTIEQRVDWHGRFANAGGAAADDHDFLNGIRRHRGPHFPTPLANSRVRPGRAMFAKRLGL